MFVKRLCNASYESFEIRKRLGYPCEVTDALDGFEEAFRQSPLELIEWFDR